MYLCTLLYTVASLFEFQRTVAEVLFPLIQKNETVLIPTTTAWIFIKLVEGKGSIKFGSRNVK